MGLHQLYVEAVSTQTQVIRALQELGFRHAVTLDDYFMTSAGETLDMVVLVLHLVDRSGKF